MASWSTSQAPRDGTAAQPQHGVSRIQRRPLFGTQGRPVGGPAGFEPHRHRTAPCTSGYTCCRACPETLASEPRPKAQVQEQNIRTDIGSKYQTRHQRGRQTPISGKNLRYHSKNSDIGPDIASDITGEGKLRYRGKTSDVTAKTPMSDPISGLTSRLLGGAPFLQLVISEFLS